MLSIVIFTSIDQWPPYLYSRYICIKCLLPFLALPLFESPAKFICKEKLVFKASIKYYFWNKQTLAIYWTAKYILNFCYNGTNRNNIEMKIEVKWKHICYLGAPIPTLDELPGACLTQQMLIIQLLTIWNS